MLSFVVMLIFHQLLKTPHTVDILLIFYACRTLENRVFWIPLGTMFRSWIVFQ